MHHDEDLTAAERLEALAELFARGVDRLAMQRTRKHTQGIYPTRCTRSTRSPEARRHWLSSQIGNLSPPRYQNFSESRDAALT